MNCIEKCKDDTLVEKLSNNCKEIDAHKYSSDTHVRRLIQVYESVLAPQEGNS